MSAGRSERPQVAAARRVGVTDERVLAAMAAVPRERFVPPAARSEADLDRPLRIGSNQTTSQPSLIATMLQALRLTGTERVLEVGTGFGYQAALLAHLVAEVVTVERHALLADRARGNLVAVGLAHVTVLVGDGTLGAPEYAPFDAITVAAAAPAVPPALAEQLAPGGRLVAPIGPRGQQVVVVYEYRDGQLVVVERLTAVRFVPLVSDGPDRLGRDR
ncbi:MAG: protein-L-isoaspartate(D-aspartate) O-methyltransferase [Nitriliruptor sp.]|uniref:protein-L-isoaspartate(D-aspartate) O-methyltransferase n=1 Tax=Nitriliruptor sp. TaxID=2448056 RepID=UPI0034A06AC7